MRPATLSALQVAALLLSASYGIGFLFGSGEQALGHGMGGALYGVATALGMLALAAVAPRLWQRGLAIWDLFGEALGARAGRVVAALSLVWMSGVLAAQLHGGVAVVRLLGLDEALSLPVVAALVVGASCITLHRAAGLFSACLAASAAVLLYAVWAQGGVVWLWRAPAGFGEGMASLGWARSGVMALVIALLVCTGADYHQFLIAARSARAAAVGSALAGLMLAGLAFLPPALALAFVAQGHGVGSGGNAQVVPSALAAAAQGLAPGAGPLMLGVLGTAALGSGAAILRAMAQAVQGAAPPGWPLPATVARLMALLPALALTLRGQGIVDTMVSVNAIYIATVGVTLAALLRGRSRGPYVELWTMAAGGLTGSALYLTAWVIGWSADVDAAVLGAGLGVAWFTRQVLRDRELGAFGHDKRPFLGGR